MILSPLSIKKVSPGDLAKVGVIVLLGMPFSLFVAGGLVKGIRKLSNVSLLPVVAGTPLPPYHLYHKARE